MSNDPLRIGVDIGGTFTDFVILHPEKKRIETFKILSTPDDPARAVLEGLSQYILPAGTPIQIVHGSTVATNALLERKGATTALVTTQGFADVLQIARQNRPELYDLFSDPPAPLVPTHLRLEAPERISAEGEVLLPLQAESLAALEPVLRHHQVESVAVCLLFSFLRPEHEALIAQRLRAAGYFVSVSSEITPEYREYERMSTTVINAYVTPILDRYLARLQTGLTPTADTISLSVMQSNGGTISVETARQFGVHCILSGPAGGITAAQFIGVQALSPEDSKALKLITFDMGGTSTDVSLILGCAQVTTEATIGGFPIRIPMLDIHTIGTGGGSIASVDLGGALRVGPQSAGADPGPACYGRLDPESFPNQVHATVTDANLVLGRLDPDAFLGGQMRLYPHYARQVMENLGKTIGLSAVETAFGVVAVVNAHMERALRVISIARGHDPRDFTLLAFGGAGGLHACELARRLGIPQVLIPPYASTLSALGMLTANTIKDYSQTVMVTAAIPFSEIEALFTPMLTRAAQDLKKEGFSSENIILEASLDMRYRGQSFELNIPYTAGADILAEFHAAHQKAYGTHRPEVPPAQVEIVNIRVKATGIIQPPILPRLPGAGDDPGAAYLGTRPVYLEPGQPYPTPFYRGELLRPGNRIAGPALIVRADTTLLLGVLDDAQVDPYLNLIIQVNPSSNG